MNRVNVCHLQAVVLKEMNFLCLLYLPFARTGSRDGGYILRMTKSLPGSDYLTLFCYVREKYTSKGFKPLYFCISIAAWTVHCRVPLAFRAGLIFHSVCVGFPSLNYSVYCQILLVY